MGKLIIRRSSTWGDKLRTYKIFLDENEVGRIRQNEEFSFNCSTGKHKLTLKVDWCSSSKNFEISPNNNDVIFVCRSNITGWKMLFIMFFIFMPRKWIHLEQKPLIK